MKDDRTEIRQKIDGWFELHSDEMFEDISRLIAIKSVRGPAEEGAPYGTGPREALSLAQSILEEHGFTVSVFEDMIITADIGPAPPLMGIMAHLDVVETGDGWNTDPFIMAKKDGRIYGRGATDNKGPSVASMYAMRCARELYPDMPGGCRLILGSGEETGCTDIAQYLSKNDPQPNVFTPDAGFPVINIEKGRILPFFKASWEKDLALPRLVSITGGNSTNVVPGLVEAVVEGFSLHDAETFCREFSEKTGASISAREDVGRLVLSAEGKSAHAARPFEGLNALTALLETLASMPFAQSPGFGYIRALNRLFPHGDIHGEGLGIAMSDEKTGQLTLNFGVLGYTETDLTGNFDSRTPACADEIDLLGMTRESLEREGFVMTDSTISHCHHTPEESPFVQTLLRIYHEYTGNPGHCLSTGGQTYVHEIPGGVVFGVGLSGLSDGVHGANEHVDVRHLINSAKMFTQTILDMCG